MSGEVGFGGTPLPREQREALARAKRLELITLAYMVTSVSAVAATMGSSQAMQTAWVEDLLAFIPPIAFLVAVRRARKEPTPAHPYGFHRSVAIGHLAAAVALLGVGTSLAVDSLIGLLSAEHPPIGTVRWFGHTFWAGWPMIAAMVYTAIGPFLLGRMKLPLAEVLHDKVLYADADMQKADWRTALGTVLGVLGIGLGWWWADSSVALLISLSVVRDGWTNLRFASQDLMDGRARTFDDEAPHPLVQRAADTLVALDWVEACEVRVRDQGHVFHVEAFVTTPEPTGAARFEEAAQLVRDLDWKLNDVVVSPVRELPGLGTAARS